MPYKPKKPCRYPGCPALIDPSERYCSKHKSIANYYYDRYRRNPVTKIKYGRPWQKIRNAYIAEHPICEVCHSARATEVHHKLPLKCGGTHDIENLQALCKSCHSRIHFAIGDRNFKL